MCNFPFSPIVLISYLKSEYAKKSEKNIEIQLARHIYHSFYVCTDAIFLIKLYGHNTKEEDIYIPDAEKRKISIGSKHI